MKTTSALSATAILMACAFVAQAQPKLYAASSKAQGAPFDISIAETQREETRSLVSVPGFDARTAPGTRWLMCAYTDMAIKRGFTYWSVMYPPEASEVLVVAFSNTAGASPKDLFGPEYVNERVIGKDMTPVEKFLQFCGLRG